MKKSNLKTYLDYYLTLDAPGFAVLVTGDWGSGKTYQILNAIPTELQCHVSLFGISESKDVYSTVFAKMYPGKHFAKKMIDLTKDMTSELNGITFGAGALAGNILGPLIKETVDPTKIIIFDDLERCPMGIKEILGVINQYVEHHHCKVIILAHDEKTHDDFISTKEKIIGHTIRISPQINDAAQVFFKNKFKLNNFTAIKPYIINAFKKTDCQSLRVLKYVINDCDRLLSSLEPLHIKNNEAMLSLFTTFCIFNIEYRLGNITINDIENVQKNYDEYALLVGKGEGKLENLDQSLEGRVRFFKKYNELEIISNIINQTLLANILLTGDYPSKEIALSLNTSRYFIQQQKTAPWLTIMNFDHIDDDIIQVAIDELFEKLKMFEVIDLGEMIHSFCLLFLLSAKNAISLNNDELLSFQIKYIDDLLDKGLLPPTSLNFDPFEDDIYERSYSHRYWIENSYEDYINQVIDHLKCKRVLSRVKKYPVFAQEILSTLESNVDQFKFLLLGAGSESGIYSHIDILKTIPPEDFVIHWLMLPVESWDKVRIVLNSRYRGASHSILKNEKLWLSELCIQLKFEAKLYEGLQRSRIERLVPYIALKSF